MNDARANGGHEDIFSDVRQEWPAMDPHEEARLVTYHKTGSALAASVLKKCLQGKHINFSGRGNIVGTPAVLFTRDPVALTTSAYLYHLEAVESWLTDPRYPGKHMGFMTNDTMLAPLWKSNECYQDFLNRVPLKLGVRAEYLRSFNEVEKIVAAVGDCANKRATKCKQVCLEDFTVSSASYKSAWAGILKFIGVKPASVWNCTAGYDLLSPRYRGGQYDRDHATSLHTNAKRIAHVMETVVSTDNALKNGMLQAYAAEIGCGAKRSMLTSELPNEDGITYFGIQDILS